MHENPVYREWWAFVQDRGHRRRVVVAHGSEGWDAFDEGLGNGECEALETNEQTKRR